ncbi:YggS family pyridoxal phosphate-dependent enzyme [Eudoraea chungangensis]|uniref:YggS family pyridoxal phosphate-dependent enzyme n=1 Tax=Eudoraea chungangensis TaxID=1481905 RepID=UPI0023ECF01A|nr:YggS family pyridoxal phosphate-dependent enzyme [Eudoraea chungangensis]
MSIKANLERIHKSLPGKTILVAVSKTKSKEEIMEAYETGQRIFGENKVQEMVSKWENLPKDIRWHMIGHVQTNKVKYMAPFVSLIHGVDSLKLLKEINKQGLKNQRVIDCLLQVHIAKEDSKFGLSEEGLMAVLKDITNLELKNIRITGLMGMATYTDETNTIRSEFKYLKRLFDQIREKNENLRVLSMGMSADYKIAIEEGSTMVRIGSSIFGQRNY